MNSKIKICVSLCIIAIIIAITAILQRNLDKESLDTSQNETISNSKICWGIKRNDNHEQPDVGDKNKKILEENNGICLGNQEKKIIYLTFDEGYEAGYTQQLLQTLKENDVKAAFFITAHYLNTQEELVKKMIEEGHIVGNHTPRYLMSRIEEVKNIAFENWSNL